MGKHGRTAIQFIWTALTNGFWKGFFSGKIYQGPLKQVCLPGLNCYSCPGALGSCPVGALQATLDSGKFRIPFYVGGFLIFFGALLGRCVCGFLCPFGLVQDLLYKIPVPRKLRTLPGDKALRQLKYLVLGLFVIILPMTVTGIAAGGKPWFCQYICPSGTLMGGIPLLLKNENLRKAAGLLFDWKILALLVVLVGSVFIYRPFCRYLCPLGAIYGFFNPVAVFRYRIDKDACISCGKCTQACPMAIDVQANVNSPECVRCGSCIAACPKGCIRRTMIDRTGDPGRAGEQTAAGPAGQ